LTERELQVLQALAHGLSNREIANSLVITEGTVKNHVSSLIDKLGVRDRTQAVLKAQELGLIA
jgi:DNA-binding NarL/FixJ family response regulator